MRRLSYLIMVAAAILVLPTLAMAGNQEVAEQVAANLKKSGQLQGYKIGVKYQEGTAWLRGRVTSHEQMNSALRVAFETQGVERVVNNLTVDTTLQTASTTQETAPKRTRISVSRLLGNTLRPMNGAMAPERRLASSTVALHRSSTSKIATQTARKLQERSTLKLSEASPVATTFDPTPAVPVAAEAKVQRQTGPIAELQAPPAPAMEQPRLVAQGQPQPIGQPVPVGYVQNEAAVPAQQYLAPVGSGAVPARYDQPTMPNYAWPSYAAHPNYAAVTYPRQYSPMCWPYMGPFYPYPQVPLGWRKVTLEWHDGWWNLDFDDGTAHGPFSGLFRPHH